MTKGSSNGQPQKVFFVGKIIFIFSRFFVGIVDGIQIFKYYGGLYTSY